VQTGHERVHYFDAVSSATGTAKRSKRLWINKDYGTIRQFEVSYVSLKSVIALSCLSIICPASNGEQAIAMVTMLLGHTSTQSQDDLCGLLRWWYSQLSPAKSQNKRRNFKNHQITASLAGVQFHDGSWEKHRTTWRNCGKLRRKQLTEKTKQWLHYLLIAGLRCRWWRPWGRPAQSCQSSRLTDRNSSRQAASFVRPSWTDICQGTGSLPTSSEQGISPSLSVPGHRHNVPPR